MKAVFYWGKTGSGKTLHAVFDALVDYINPVKPRQIYTNMQSLKIPCVKLDLIDLVTAVSSENNDIIDNSPKTLLLDEIQTLMDGRRAMTKLNIDLSLFISQCRKRGFNIIYTSQYISGADPRLRQLTDKLVRCVSMHRNSEEKPYAFKYFIIDVLTGQMKVKTWNGKLADIFGRYYDTYEVIRPVEEYVS